MHQISIDAISTACQTHNAPALILPQESATRRMAITLLQCSWGNMDITYWEKHAETLSRDELAAEQIRDLQATVDRALETPFNGS